MTQQQLETACDAVVETSGLVRHGQLRTVFGSTYELPILTLTHAFLFTAMRFGQ